MKEKLKKFWNARIATGMFVTFIGFGLMASGAMSKRLAAAA